MSSISYRYILFLFRLRSTSAATLRISCNTYADALNSIEFCIVRLFLCHFVRHLGICNPIFVKLLPLMCAVITHNSVKKQSLYINKWLSYSQLVFHGRHFVGHLGIFNPICVKLLELMSGVITHNSVKKRSNYINKWLSYDHL